MSISSNTLGAASVSGVRERIEKKIVFSLTEPGLQRRDSNEKNDAHRLQGAVIEAKV
jgi:hypothetical protein